jgi:DNA-binding HxlR family transcriptional regulator
VTKKKETMMCICPLGDLMDLISKKWALLVINTIGNHEILRYNEIMKNLNGINPKSLSDRLKELESAGLIKKEVFAEVPPRSEYSLTKDGKDLRKAIIPLMEWVNTHDFKSGSPQTPCEVAKKKENMDKKSTSYTH